MKTKLTTGYYVPTANFKSIPEHIAIMDKYTTELIAVVGPSDDKPANLEETKTTAKLFAASPILKEALDDIEAKCDELLGEWAPVAPTFAPASLQGIFEIRDLARDALKSLEES